MWNLRNLKVVKRINDGADCMTVFNHEERNEVECLTHKNPEKYKDFPKFQAVGVWKTKHLKN